jgi:molecular chaperone GrpE
MDQHPDTSPEQMDASAASAPASTSCPSCDEYMAGWKRAQADYQNLKRETERERGEVSKYANERLLSDLLPAIDQFGIALRFTPDASTLPEDQRKVWENWLVGIRAVQSLWDQATSGVGLERIPTDGAFDPMLHDAAGEEESQEKPSGTILKVLQDGWRLHGKVLRPARVIVVK